MPLPALGPADSPPFVPNAWGRPLAQQTTQAVGFVVRPLIGVNIAFASPALTDEPLWIRVDDPGSR